MGSNSIDYEAVIADLMAKRESFDSAVESAIANLRYVLSVSSSGAIAATIAAPNPSSNGAMTPAPSGFAPNTFFGLGIAEAVIKYLHITKRQQTSREITDSLERAGYHHTSQNFLNTVNTALYRREKVERDVVKIGRTWALAEWYPGRRRSKKDADVQTDGVGASNGEETA